jgi:hypothetical protein
MFSKSKLVPFLKENRFITDDKKVGYEAFGRKVCAFINVADMQERARCEKALQEAKQKVNPSYWPGHPVVEVQVTYFKAWHWDE